MPPECFARRMLGIALAAALLAVGQAQASENARSADARGSYCWQTARSENFAVCCPSDVDPHEIAQKCERWRTQLMGYWLGASAAEELWPARCYVVLHPSAASYVQSVGAGAAQTYGCSSMKSEDGKVASRRIDLRLDRDDAIRRVLPHEMTHVIMAEVMSHAKSPRWADEGMAMLADLPSKQSLHEHDFSTALENGSSFRLVALLASSEYPKHDQQIFYGESLSLTRFLVDRDSPAKFVSFVQHAAEFGYDAALRDDYGIRDVAELEKIWMRNRRSTPVPEDRFRMASR